MRLVAATVLMQQALASWAQHMAEENVLKLSMPGARYLRPIGSIFSDPVEFLSKLPGQSTYFFGSGGSGQVCSSSPCPGPGTRGL
jgi:hypothetical protein